MEVFIPYSLNSNFAQLGWTLEAWDVEGFEPIALEVKNPSNEQINHVAAEAIAKGDYIIAELGSEPEIKGEVLPLEGKGWKTYQKGYGIRVEACQPRVQ